MHRCPVVGGNPSPGNGPPENGTGEPEPGELGIKERRSWHTWQLLVFGVLCLLLGMLITWSGGGTQAPKLSDEWRRCASGRGGVLDDGAGRQRVELDDGGPGYVGHDISHSDFYLAGGHHASTAGAPQVLLGPTPQSHGNWTSTPFTVGSGTWSIGWAFQCTPAPASGPSFQVFVVPTGGKAGTAPAVSGTGASGQSVTTQTSAGSQELQVEAPASCIWIVKVTGVA